MRSYPDDLVAGLLDGSVVPKNGRILCKAVTRHELRESSIILPEGVQATEVRTAPFHEIVAVADDVEDPDMRPGALCQFVSAAADFAQDKQYVFVKATHIIAVEAA